jgi:hypothetical protein
MADYRDELGALHARIESLERELEDARAKGDERPPDDEAASELARAKKRIDALNRDLRRTKEDLADAKRGAPRTVPTQRGGMSGITIVLVLGLVGVAFIFAVASSGSKVHAPTVRPPTRSSVSEPTYQRQSLDCMMACNDTCALYGDSGSPSATASQADCLTTCWDRCPKVPK